MPDLIPAIRVTARVLTGATYAVLGFQAAKTPGPRVDMAKSTLASIRKVAPFLPDDDQAVVRANATVQAATGVLIAAGRLQRGAALTLVGSLVPTTLAGHSFWTLEDPAAKKAQKVQFMKNVAMLAGVLYAAVDGGGRRKQHA